MLVWKLDKDKGKLKLCNGYALMILNVTLFVCFLEHSIVLRTQTHKHYDHYYHLQTPPRFGDQ